MKKITLKDIAIKCGISVAAVSMALNNSKKISQAMRIQVNEVACALGYTVKKSGRNQILILCTSLKDICIGEYYNEVTYGLINFFRGTDVLLAFSDIQTFQSSILYDCSGVIVVGKISDELLIKLKESRRPFVLCGHPVKDLNVSCVYPDFVAGYGSILDYVLSCNHTRIGLITGENGQDDQLTAIIRQTFIQKLQQHSLSPGEDHIETASYGNLQSGVIAFNKLLSIRPKLTAIVFSDDQFAYRALYEAAKYKLRVPDELSLTGFDGIFTHWYLELPSPQLTTVYIDKPGLAKKAAEILLEKIASPKLKPHHFLMPVALTVKDSVIRYTGD